VYREHGEELVVTSTYEGDHSAGSLHYADLAFDIRLPKAKATTIALEIQQALGEDFDVVLEPTHIHIEYDPK